MKSTFSRRTACLGLSLVEAMLAAGTLAATLGATLPGLQESRQRRQLEAASAQLATDIHHTRSLAVARSETLRLRVQTLSDGACYVVHSGPVNSCSCRSDGSTSCTAPAAQVLRAAGFDARQPVRLRANSGSMSFDPQHGTVTPTATLALTLPDGQGLNNVVNIMGRVRRCAVATPIAGYPAC